MHDAPQRPSAGMPPASPLRPTCRRRRRRPPTPWRPARSFPPQARHAGRLRATTACQHQMPDTVLADQMPDDHLAERTGPARDQDGARSRDASPRRGAAGAGSRAAASRGSQGGGGPPRNLPIDGSPAPRPAAPQSRSGAGRCAGHRRSASTMRLGFSAWAERTNPATAAPARSGGPSPRMPSAALVTTASWPGESLISQPGLHHAEHPAVSRRLILRVAPQVSTSVPRPQPRPARTRSARRAHPPYPTGRGPARPLVRAVRRHE